MGGTQDYSQKPDGYFQVAQERVADFVVGTGHRILEIGCGEGNTGAYLKQVGKAAVVHGVELVPAAAEQARQHLDSVITGDIESVELPFENHTFNYVIATETLEHLVNPVEVLKRLRLLLQPEGAVIASVPNMRHVRLLWHLAIQGDWHYQDAGPLDRTHLRFFTKRSLVRMLTDAGYDVLSTDPVLLSKAHSLNRVTLGRVEEFLAFRYYCVGRPRS